MSLLEFPDDMFTRRPNEPAIYGHEPMVKRYAEHVKSFTSPEDWARRRLAVAKSFYLSLIGETKDPSGKGRFFDQRDQLAWYLFLAEAFNDHPQNYEVVFGCRVIPLFAALGSNLDNLLRVDGYQERLRRLVSSDKAQPNGGFFEFLVAAAYVRDGYDVAFVPDRPGLARTHDINVRKTGAAYAVECKRMEGGEYYEMERQRMRELWNPAAHLLARLPSSSYLDVHFKTPLPQVSEDYLVSVAARFMDSRRDNLIFEDEFAWGILRELDIGPLQKSLEASYWLHPGPQYIEKLLGSYRRYDNLLLAQKLKFASNPHFVDAIDQAIAARWTSLSEEAIDRKARDVLSKVVDANKQLPTDIPGIIHVGFETLSGDEVERRRYEKIKASVSNFDPAGKPLEVVFCHYFAPEASPTETWAIDETVHYHARRPGPLPLSKSSLIIPDDVPTRPGVHWDGLS